MRRREFGKCSFFLGRWMRPMAAGLLMGVALPVVAQSDGATTADGAAVPAVVASADAGLPEAPVAQKSDGQPLMAAAPTSVAATSTMPMAPMYARVVPAGMSTPQLHGRDKITVAARDLYSPTSIADFFVSAGWSHLVNGQPNYGTNSGAFAQRVGAAAIRDSAQAFLSNGPFAEWTHEDPRYFALGSRYSIGRRVWYSVTRAVVTRNSTDGHAVVNTSLILGQAAGTALNNLYYPKSNRNFHDNIASFGGSIGGAALSFAWDEFTSDLLRMVRLKHGERSAP